MPDPCSLMIRRGEGTPVLFLGGMLQPSEPSQDLVQALNKKGYQYVGMAYRGHFDVNEPFKLEDIIEDAANVIESLGQPVNVIGEALGGTLALALAQQRPDLVRSCCVSGVRTLRDIRRAYRFKAIFGLFEDGYFDDFAEVVVEESFSLEWRQKYPQQAASVQELLFRDRTPESLSRLFRAAASYSRFAIKFEKIDLPVLVLAAEKDTLVDPQHAQKLKDILPNAQLLKISCGHAISIEKGTELGEIALEFFRQHS